jgi:DNA-binding transcriptional regulator LsrR (DeoR family)
MTDPVGGKDRLGLVTTVLAARRYFLDGATKSEIATELGISRFKVARLLDDALRDGIVRIEIDAVPEIDEVLSREVAVVTGIRSAIVVRDLGGPPELERSQLGRAAAAVLADALDDGDILGISWGRSLHALIGHLPPLPGCDVVQLVGIVPTLDLAVNSLELVRRLADRAGGRVHPLHVPIVVERPELAAALRDDPHVQRTMAMYPRLTRAVVGIGSWRTGSSSLRQALSDADARAIDEAGAVADCCSILLDAGGQEVRTAGLPERCLAISAEELRHVPDVLAVSAGTDKVGGIRATLRSGLVHRLVTTEATARALVAGTSG